MTETIAKYNNNNYLVCKISSKEKDTFILGMLKNNTIEGTLVAEIEDMGMDVALRYNITNCRSLNECIYNINKSYVLNIYKAICNTLMIAEEYMLEYNSFLIDKEHIYIDENGNVKLLYVPKKLDNNATINEILKEFLTSLVFDMNEDVSYVVSLLNYFNKEDVSLCEFAKIIDDMLSDMPNNELGKVPVFANNQTVFEEDAGIEININSDVVEEDIPMEQTNTEEATNELVTSDTFNQVSQDELGNYVYNNPTDINSIQPINSVDNMQPMNNGYGQIPFDIGLEELEQNINMQNSLQEDIQADFTDITNDINEDIDEKPKKKGLFGFSRKKHKNDLKKEQEINELQQDNNFGDKTTVLSEIISEPRLIRLCNSEVIYIDKTVYKLGKDPSFADYCVNDNPAISRAHAEIIIDNGNFYVLDNNSLNHTYVNNNQIESQIRIPIGDGTIIRLANEEFEFRIS